ncbi:copper homeostasis protein CutC [Arsenophonus endosymbiont of Bemisia tabaci]|uniref:copper homeostasis protein CutC n=1 Tax=Arsenophonus endosymbiont of Bemisia tabaci TaxID=536059 RepID=UPI0015F38D3C|nr:copper homeostasis protein CutC [Arsenophonus endosymbiont of Bemisia tabaci]CAA2930394.1 Copper homeostasis protein CutC [Arsenophonus endosymbiont of Bemisia tabaci Q2]
MITLEICCYGAECALISEKCGADRIELFSSAAEGGLTPSYGCLKQTKDTIKIPVHPIVRPRGGDFCYSDSEFETIKDDVIFIKQLGFPGVVYGILNREEHGHIDIRRMRILKALSGDMAITFHRAFDVCISPKQAYVQLTELSVARILTSGQQHNAECVLPLLKELNALSSKTPNGPIIMAGAGVKLANFQKFIDAGLPEVHTSAGRVMKSTMNYRKAGVTMSSNMEIDEFTHYCADSDVVEAMKNLLAIANFISDC